MCQTTMKYGLQLQSAGMVCFLMMSGGIHPYALDGKRSTVAGNIVTGTYFLSAVKDLVACDLVEQMLAHEPSKRPSARELL